jgi:hypothetical protein
VKLSARRRIEEVAIEIRRGDWSCASATLQRLELEHGLRAVYELGLRVGQWSYGDALALAGAHGWSPKPGPREVSEDTEDEP